MEYTKEEKELCARFALGQITEVQYNWKISENGWDREKLDAYVNRIKEVPFWLLAGTVLFLFGLGCFIYSFFV